MTTLDDTESEIVRRAALSVPGVTAVFDADPLTEMLRGAASLVPGHEDDSAVIRAVIAIDGAQPARVIAAAVRQSLAEAFGVVEHDHPDIRVTVSEIGD